MRRREALKTMLATGAAAAIAGPARADDGYYVPAEERRHERTFMQWPVSREVYRDRFFLEQVQATIARIANTIADFEPVVMLAAGADHGQARRLLSDAVDLWDVPTEDLWCRDSGPLFAIDGRGGLIVRDIRFNGWGGKQVHTQDAQVARRVADRLGVEVTPTPLKGEPGGVEQDGHGQLIAHESSWIIGNRNPKMGRAAVTSALLAAYGADRLVWSKGVRDQDITDYHIDSLARFTAPGRVLVNLPEDPDPRDAFHVAALDTVDALNEAGFEVDVIPEPQKPRVRSRDFVASYVNFYVCNGAVIAAQFGDRRTDDIAAEALSQHYPGRAQVILNVDALGEIGGGIHCATREMPVR